MQVAVAGRIQSWSLPVDGERGLLLWAGQELVLARDGSQQDLPLRSVQGRRSRSPVRWP